MGLFDLLKRVLGKRSSTPSQRSAPMQISPPKPYESLPAWAAHFQTVDDVNEFERLVDAYFRKRNIAAFVHEGIAHRIGDDGKPNGHQSGLTKVSQMCSASERWEWSGLIAAHFDTLDRAGRNQAESDPKFKSYDWCESRLVTRLIQPIDGDVTPKWHCRQDFEGLVTYLALDMGETFCSVLTENTKDWPGTVEQWFQIAEANARRIAPATHAVESLPDELELHLIQTADHVAAWSKALDQFSQIFGTFGAFVSMPTSSLIVALPIHGVDAIGHLQSFISITMGLDRDGPGSISPYVYWVKDDVWHKFEIVVDGQSVRITPPDAFVELMNSLAGDEPNASQS